MSEGEQNGGPPKVVVALLCAIMAVVALLWILVQSTTGSDRRSPEDRRWSAELRERSEKVGRLKKSRKAQALQQQRERLKSLLPHAEVFTEQDKAEAIRDFDRLLERKPKADAVQFLAKRERLLLDSHPEREVSTPAPSPTPDVAALLSQPRREERGLIHVRGYYRKDGTYVRPHTRSR